MAVKYIQGGGGGILGNLGDLATLGGLAIPGAGWLTALGLGMKATDGIINGRRGGGSGSTLGDLSKLKDIITGESWKNPASGTVAKVEENPIIPQSNDDELYARGWGFWQ